MINDINELNLKVKRFHFHCFKFQTKIFFSTLYVYLLLSQVSDGKFKYFLYKAFCARYVHSDKICQFSHDIVTLIVIQWYTGRSPVHSNGALDKSYQFYHSQVTIIYSRWGLIKCPRMQRFSLNELIRPISCYSVKLCS